MIPSPLISLILVAISPVFVAGQTGAPAYLSPVLLKPGLDGRKCIQPAGASSADGTGVVLADCTGASAQEFFFESGRVRVFSNKCLTVPGGSQANDVQLQIQTCNGTDPNQQWYYNFKNKNQLSWAAHRGKCVDLTGGSTANGAKVSTRTCVTADANQVWNSGYLVDQQPSKSQSGQSGYNNCGGGSSQSSKCQTAWINDVDDFCLWAPPTAGGTIGDTERLEVAWCTKSGRGTRTIPNGTLKGVHFVKTPHYVQVTGQGDFTKINIKAKDSGGELDPHGPDGLGNPVGGLVYGNGHGKNLQYHEWTSFISSGEFCFRACVGKDASKLCQHIYDVLGCYWNMPGNYDKGVFESCDGDDALPMGIYGTSTFHQGQSVTPPAHPAPSSSNCDRISTVTLGTTTAGSPSTTTSAPKPPTTPVTGHAIRPQASSSKCLTAASLTKGAKVTLQTCNGSAGQQFVRNGKTFRIGNLCLDVPSGANTNGTKLQVYTCTSGSTNPNQSWDTNSKGQLIWTGKNKCLDLTKGSTANGNPLQIWACSSAGTNQIWSVV